MTVSKFLSEFLSKQMIAKVTKWQRNSKEDSGQYDFEIVDSLNEANVVTSFVGDAGEFESNSLVTTRRHRVALDIDHPAELIPSSTPGKFHLYIDVLVPEHDYFYMLDAMAQAGIVEPGYVSASRNRGFTALRLPWIKKPWSCGHKNYGDEQNPASVFDDCPACKQFYCQDCNFDKHVCGGCGKPLEHNMLNEVGGLVHPVCW